MRVLATLAISALVVFILVVLFVYVLLPGIIESRLAASLRESYGLEEEPTVEVSSNFPPELLFGRMDRIEVRMDSFVREGIRLRDVRVDLRGVDVPVRSLLSGGTWSVRPARSPSSPVCRRRRSTPTSARTTLGSRGAR